jgi:ribosome-binding protein aMBF1 (putative translation factor)
MIINIIIEIRINMANYWKNYQDLNPVVLTKSKSVSKSTNTASKSNIHINKVIIEDDNEAHRIITYTKDQCNNIIAARNKLGLTQEQLAKKVNCSLPKSFIVNIENGTTKYNQQTYNTLKRILNI